MPPRICSAHEVHANAPRVHAWDDTGPQLTYCDRPTVPAADVALTLHSALCEICAPRYAAAAAAPNSGVESMTLAAARAAQVNAQRHGNQQD